jgi:hypothetical protein
VGEEVWSSQEMEIGDKVSANIYVYYTELENVLREYGFASCNVF